MLDFNAPEFLVVAIVALLVIGPKDLPKALRFLGKWVGKARGVARQFRSGFDDMVRQSELAEMEKQWAAENERIMREHPVASLPAPEPDYFTGEETDPDPVIVEQPALTDSAEPPVKPKRVRKPKQPAVEMVADDTEAAPRVRTTKAAE